MYPVLFARLYCCFPSVSQAFIPSSQFPKSCRSLLVSFVIFCCLLPVPSLLSVFMFWTLPTTSRSTTTTPQPYVLLHCKTLQPRLVMSTYYPSLTQRALTSFGILTQLYEFLESKTYSYSLCWLFENFVRFVCVDWTWFCKSLKQREKGGSGGMGATETICSHLQWLLS